MHADELKALIKGCRRKDRSSQKKLFMHMYGYGMSVASRYSNSREDAEEIANEGFYRMLDRIEKYDDSIPFKFWVRRIIINHAIDRHRKEKRSKEVRIHAPHFDINQGLVSTQTNDLLRMVQQLSPKYRIVFSMYAIDGYTHAEISEELGISIGTSKSNLARARKKLQELLKKHELKSTRYGQQ